MVDGGLRLDQDGSRTRTGRASGKYRELDATALACTYHPAIREPRRRCHHPLRLVAPMPAADHLLLRHRILSTPTREYTSVTLQREPDYPSAARAAPAGPIGPLRYRRCARGRAIARRVHQTSASASSDIQTMMSRTRSKERSRASGTSRRISPSRLRISECRMTHHMASQMST
jgi:hypothetical protein